jgi:hypothetical protein
LQDPQRHPLQTTPSWLLVYGCKALRQSIFLAWLDQQVYMYQCMCLKSDSLTFCLLLMHRDHWMWPQGDHDCHTMALFAMQHTVLAQKTGQYDDKRLWESNWFHHGGGCGVLSVAVWVIYIHRYEDHIWPTVKSILELKTCHEF